MSSLKVEAPHREFFYNGMMRHPFLLMVRSQWIHHLGTLSAHDGQRNCVPVKYTNAQFEVGGMRVLITLKNESGGQSGRRTAASRR
jgi:hypothetical protein